MILIIDNFDSFTYNLVHYIEELGESTKCIRIDQLNLSIIIQLNPKGIVISPGPGEPKDYPLLFEVINYYKNKIPILGVCLGHQTIGVFFGASLIKTSPIHGKVRKIEHYQHKMFKNIPTQFNVTRYHSLVLKNPPNNLQITAQTLDGHIMALAHKEYKIWGVQYHPEAALTEYGHSFLQNWLQI